MTRPIALIGAEARGNAIGARRVTIATPLTGFDLDPAKVAVPAGPGATAASAADTATGALDRCPSDPHLDAPDHPMRRAATEPAPSRHVTGRVRHHVTTAHGVAPA